jgi:SWI/SNF-related matrix-associated actin-dependent regulator of chromatin subfamily A3
VDVKVVGDMSVLDAKLMPTQSSTGNQRFQLQDKSDHILLSFPDGTEFGYLRVNMTKGLSELLAVSKLDFEAVVDTDDLRDTIGRANKAADALVRVHVNIYGPPSQADIVGSKLSSHKLWLQKPDFARRDVVYQNPQFLEFEGIDASILEKPSEVLERGRPKPRTEEDHLRQAVAEVYNASRRQEDLAQMAASGRFRTSMLKYAMIGPKQRPTLTNAYRHQKEALTFMMQRETGDIPDQFRLWKEVVVEGLTRYSLNLPRFVIDPADPYPNHV